MEDGGMQVPALQERPSLTGLTWLWEAFQDLSSCRMIGMDVGPIPWTAIEAYIEAGEYSIEEGYILHRVVRHLDIVFHKEQEKLRKK